MINQNENLGDIDKFSYVGGLLVGPARSAIAGFALTSANIGCGGAAKEALRKEDGDSSRPCEQAAQYTTSVQ